MPSPALSSGDRHVVFGAGPLGRAAAVALARDGHRVRIVNRSGRVTGLPPAIEAVAADLGDAVAAGLAAAAAETLYLCAQPAYHRWPQEFPALQAAMIDVAERSGARLILVENLYAYGPANGPFTETTALRPCSRKGEVRARMHEAAMAAHHAGRVEIAVARGSDFFGPGVEASVVGGRLFRAIRAGRPAELFGDPTMPHSLTYVGDFGRALAILGADRRSSGAVWHVPNAPAIGMADFVAAAAQLAGRKARMRRVGRFSLGLAGLFLPAAREMAEMLYQYEAPMVVDHARFAATFGDIATPLDAALGETLAATDGPAR